MTRYQVTIVNLDDRSNPNRNRYTTFEGTEDDVEAVWDEVDSALHLIRSFGRKQDARSVAKRHEKNLKQFTAKGKLRDLK